MKLFRNILLIALGSFLAALLVLSIPDITVRAAGNSASTGVGTLSTVSNWNSIVTLLQSNGPYGTNNAGTNLFYYIVTTTLLTNSAPLIQFCDHNSFVYLTNEGPSNLWVSSVNPVITKNAFVLPNAQTLTFPIVAGAGIPAALYGSTLSPCNSTVYGEQFEVIQGP